MLSNILAVGLMSMGMGLSGVKDEPQQVLRDTPLEVKVFENDFTVEDASNLGTWLNENGYSNNNRYDMQQTYTLAEGYTYRYMYPTITDGTVTAIYLSTSSSSTGSSIGSYSVSQESFRAYGSNSLISPYTFTAPKEAFPEPPMGEQIIPAIASGLGLIGALASEFLVGFGALFYTEGALTPFAVFALVMLGIAVSFAVVKLVLNLIRSNTGA